MKNLAIKLSKIQGLQVKKEATNPFYNSKYATLDNIVHTLDPLIKENNLVIYHFTNNREINTVVYDIDSDESITSRFPLVETNDPQKYGSCITYAKRYNLVQIFNILSDDDDDGNSVVKNQEYKVPEWDTHLQDQVKIAEKEFSAPTKNQGYGMCEYCGAPNVKNPKTEKVFCSKKCWTRK